MTVSVENLRKAADFMQQASGVDPAWLREAADEIARLRREYIELEKESHRDYQALEAECGRLQAKLNGVVGGSGGEGLRHDG